jgi:hypothetical protein
MLYVGNTFSPMMLAKGDITRASVCEITLTRAKALLVRNEYFVPCISHENTAPVVSALLGVNIIFSRVNISLENGDTLLCIIPAFRATEAREFTVEEVEAAGYRCFLVFCKSI